ncbi:MAG: Uncharacterized protein XE11_1068 [Methanomicrobiales archaeon 53_19]|nr:MAG: Uncharacterized protein XD88_0461 [Methanocalculus sp. 52_23]KUL03733.1 MAG: Uncharacterized protein XE11_1068 [Methanomicrobiales archaeon 53_19]
MNVIAMDTRYLILSLALILLLTAGTVAAAPSAGEPQHVIIVMKDQPARSMGSAELMAFSETSQRDILSSVDQMSADEPRSLWSVNAIAATLTEEQVKQVAARSDVERVIPDYIVTLDLLRESEVTEKGDRGMQFIKPPGEGEVEWIEPSYPYEEDIAWGVSWIEAPEVWANGFDGTGVTVAVVDTGIDPDHPDLAGKIVGWADLVNNQTEPYDDYGHGTHCAGIVAGTGAGGKYTGVAPGADLIGVKVFNASGDATLSQVLGGFEAAVEMGADIISYSAGYSKWKPPFVRENVINTQEGVTYEFPVTHYDDVYDPSFTLLWVNAPPFANISITMEQPDGTVFSGVDCDWYEIPRPDDWTMLKFTGDDPLQAGNWTLNLAVPGFNESNMVWYSGKGNNLDNILEQRIDFSDYMGVLDTATFEMNTWYDMEEDYDYAYLEVYNVELDRWDTLLEITGDGQGTYTADLSDYLWQQDGQDILSYIDLRLRYETDSSVIYDGWYVDWMAIPEIGFYDDASGDAGWTADPEDGWERVQEQYPFYAEWVVFYTDNGTSIQSRAVNQIVEEGTVFVTSAGNEGEFGLRTIGGPAPDKAIIVGATGYQEDYIAPYSSRGPTGWGQNQFINPDVVAPGTSIISASTREGELYHSMSGTSMAAPHVSGIAALLLQANNTLTPGNIEQLLKDSSVDLGPEGPDYDYGYGRVSAWAAMEAVTPLVPPTYDAPRLHAGFGYQDLKLNETNVITAISWNKTPVQDVPIRFVVYQDQLEFINQTVLTNASGMATATFEVNRTGYHSYQVKDSFGNVVSGSIYVHNPRTPREPLLFDTPSTSYYALPNSTVPVKYTLVDPLTMAPYTGDVRMLINYTSPQRGEVFNDTLTPVNGTIEAEINLTGTIFTYGRIFLAPVANLTQERQYGSLSIEQWDGINEDVSPFVSWAERKGNATVLVKQYTTTESEPAPDGTYELPVIWLYEVDVQALSARFPAETARLLAGEIQEQRPEYAEFFAEIENMQEDIRYIPYELKNGIGKVTVPVPDGAYLGAVLYNDPYYHSSDQAQQEYYGINAYILVNFWPFMYTPSAPAAEPDRWLSIWGEWAGEYSEEARSIAPGTELNVTCYLRNPETGEPMQGTVYLYTSDHSAVVQTNAAGYGSAILPAAVRHRHNFGLNDIQVVGLSGDAYASTAVSPPYEYVTLTGEYAAGETDGILHGEVDITSPDGEQIPMPGIFDVRQSDFVESWMNDQRWAPSASIFSSPIEGSGSYAGEQPYGSYLLKSAVKDWFWRGQYSQGNWWTYEIYVGATPLTVQNPPPPYAGHSGWIDVTVQMAGNQPDVPVYLTYDTVGPYSHFYEQSAGSLTDQYGGVDINTTGADGSATLKMYVPRNSWLWWEIGGGTPDRVFTTQSGYIIQDTPPEPVAPVANFIGLPTTGPAPLTVRFTDTSTGIPTSWRWNFGDGTTSTERHPTKTYTDAGVYTVSLTATNDQGSNTTTKTNYITALEPTTILAGNTVIPTGMNKTTGVFVASMQNMTAVGLNLTFDQTLAQLTAVRPNASVENRVEGFVTEIDNTTGKLNLSMTLQPGIDQGAEPMQIIDLVFAAEQKIGSHPITITGSEFSGGVSGDVQPFVVVDDGSLRVRMRGDFNDNGRIDIGDVARVAYMAAGLITEDLEADFNGDGVVDAADAAKIAYVYVGKYDEL